MLHPGRRFWFFVTVDDLTPFVVGPVTVTKFKQFLPAGVYEHHGSPVERKHSLIQVFTDPGGLRTLTAAEVRLQDPGKTGR